MESDKETVQLVQVSLNITVKAKQRKHCKQASKPINQPTSERSNQKRQPEQKRVNLLLASSYLTVIQLRDLSARSE